jgi:hypothetical protein
MSKLKTPNAPATEQQLEYIGSLIFKAKSPYITKVAVYERDVASRTWRDDEEHPANVLILSAYNTIALPSFTQQQASGIIDILKKPNDELLAVCLKNAGAAARLGLTSFISEHRTELAKALLVELD